MATPQTDPGYESAQPAESHLWEYVLVMLRRRRLALGVFLAVLTLGGLRVVLTRPVYSATADILIEREKSNVLTFKEVAEIDSARDDYYQTQYKLLQSRVLVRRVVESMNLLMDPEFGGPRPKAQVEAALAAPAGESALLEDTIDAF